MDDLTKKLIGTRINTALAAANLKQKDLAKELDVTDNTVSYWCNGTRTPNTDQIIQIARVLNVSSDYLLGLSYVKTTDTELQAICNYTNLSDTAVEILHYKPGFRDIEDSNKLADTISLLLEEYYKAFGGSDSLLHMIMAYPCGGFTVQKEEKEKVVDALDNFFKYHTIFSPCNDFENILMTAYIERLKHCIERFKNFSSRKV